MQKSVIVRVATVDEHPALEALFWRSALGWEEDREMLLAHKETIHLAFEHVRDGHTFVAERDGIVLGFVVLLPRVDGDVDMQKLFVEPGYWRQGIGARLVAESEKIAFERGATQIHLIANPRAKEFYDACGFETVGEKKMGIGTGVIMLKQLNHFSS